MPSPSPRPHPTRTPFTLGTRYAVLSLVFLAQEGGYHMARELAERLTFPLPYLAKVLKHLRLAGILESLRGPAGGFRLARAPQTITLREVVLAMEGNPLTHLCVLGLRTCSHAAPCPFCMLLAPVFGGLMAQLAGITLWDLTSQKSDQNHGREERNGFRIPLSSPFHPEARTER